VTTDVWTSMGYEAENEERRKAFADWCVDEEMMPWPSPTRCSCTACPRTAARKSPPRSSTARSSVVWDEAENRLHVQKALMEYLLLGRIG
jgi:ornithine carbamoyltransferase